MSNLAENPYASPTDSSPSVAIDAQPPFSIYLYAAVLFVVGGIATAFATLLAVAIIAAIWKPASFLVWIPLPLSVAGGVISARRMFHKLAGLHRKKIELQMADAERLGELYTW